MRFRSLLLAGSLILAASSAMAEDAPAKKEAAPGDATLELLGDVVDGVGGFLKVLVGPPISSPSPMLNLPGANDSAPPPAAKPAVAPPLAMPIPPPPPVPAPAPPTPPPPVIATPEPVQPPSAFPPAPVPMPAQVMVIHPFAKPAAVVPPPPPAEPACRTRAAATATLEQAARLPRCPPP